MARPKEFLARPVYALPLGFREQYADGKHRAGKLINVESEA
jgi:hypothetical protein